MGTVCNKIRIIYPYKIGRLGNSVDNNSWDKNLLFYFGSLQFFKGSQYVDFSPS